VVGSNDERVYAFDIGSGPAGPWPQYHQNARRTGRSNPASFAVTLAPKAQAAVLGQALTLNVVATGDGPFSYQWSKDGTPIAGATAATYTVPNVTDATAGDYTVTITDAESTITTPPARITVEASHQGRLTNLAVRTSAGTDAQTLIVGFAISGAGTGGTKPVLLRGVGPTLDVFPVPGFLADPKLELFDGSQVKMNENDDWGGSAQISSVGEQVGAFALRSNTSKDAALYNASFSPGRYSTWITGNNGTTGIALAEIYDATPAASYTAATPRLINVSARSQVGTGDDVLIAGFTISGQSRTVLIRAVGATLASFGVEGALANPKLELFQEQTMIVENDDWGGAAALSATFDSVGAFGLPAASTDAVLLVKLDPGGYTAKVSGVGNTTGVALVEVYDVP
jgi:hypothetical protein